MPDGYRKILCAVEGDSSGELVLRQAAGLARREQAALTVLHAISPAEDTTQNLLEAMLPADRLRELETRRRGSAEAELGDLVARTTADLPDITKVVMVGHPVPAILEQAQKLGADLIVLGTHARSGLGRAFLGSVATRVIQGASVPVLVIPVSS
jgi:nucleotide-binding universal stress UspA family protein